MAKPRILLVYHSENSPFQRIAVQIRKHLSDLADFTLSRVSDAQSDEPYDVVVGLSPRSLRAAAGMGAAGRSGIACVYDSATWRTDESLGICDLVVCGNRRLRDDVRAGAPLERTTPVLVCEDGVDTDLFSIEPGRRPGIGRVGFAASPGQSFKGAALFVAAVRPGLQEFASGAIAHSDMPAWYNSLDLFCCMSAHEGTPNTILEALSCGLEVVTTNVGVVPELLECGLPLRVIPRTADALRQVASVPSSPRPDAAAIMYQEWDWRVKIGAWRTALEAALEARPTARTVSPVFSGRSRPSVLCVADQRGWAFDVNERAMARALSKQFDFDFAYVEDGHRLFAERHDVVFAPYHRWPEPITRGLFSAPVFGSCRSDRIDIDRPEFVSDEDADWFGRCSVVHGCTRSSSKWMRGLFGKKVCYLTNPVDTSMFTGGAVPAELGIRALWAGNPGHGGAADHKGLGLIREATQRADIPLIEANYEVRKIPHDVMPEFYASGNVYVCASKYEGASNSVMEAMACGCVLVSTRVGNIVEIRDSQIKNMGDTGIFLVNRNPESIQGALLRLSRMDPEKVDYLGRLNQVEIRERWSWNKWAPAYAEQIRRAMCR